MDSLDVGLVLDRVQHRLTTAAELLLGRIRGDESILTVKSISETVAT